MPPAKPQQVIADSIGQKTLLTKIQYRNRTVTLGKLGAIRAMDQRHMGEIRPVPAHRVIDHALAESIGQVIIAADHMGDAHIVIIHHNGVQIGGRAVTPQDDHVIQFAIGDAHFALHQIRHNGFTFKRRFDSDGEWLAGLFRARFTIPPTAVIPWRATFRRSAFAHFGQFFRRRPAAIGLAHRQQSLCDFTMPCLPLGLEDRWFIRRKSKPRQAIQNLVNRFLCRAFAVRILDTQQVFPAVVARKKPVEQSGASPADMQIAGGGRGEARTNCHGVLIILLMPCL